MFNEIPIDINNKNAQSQEIKQQALQEQAYEELERILLDCDTMDALIIEVSNWQDRYNIIDIDDFFGDNTELASKVHQLIAAKLEELRIKENQEKALTDALAMVAQKKTFYRLYSILSEAKNDKDFERANEKLKAWLKDHPEKTWEQFTEQYQSYFKKVANKDYLEYITGKATQDKIVLTIEEIYDHATRYSDYAFFHENIQKFQSDYSTRDQFLSAEQKEKIEALIKDGYEKLMPPEITENQIAEFDSQNGAFVYQSLAFSISSSSSKETALMEWLALNGATLTDLGSNDKEKISELLMQKFKINIIPDKFDYSAKSIEDDTSVKNVQANTINYVLYKLNSSDGITMEDIGIFQAASVKSDLSEIAVKLEPMIEEAVVEKSTVEAPTAEDPTVEEPIAEEPIAEEPIAEEPTAEEPTAEEPIAEEPIAEEPTAEEPIAEEPTAEEPIVEEPIAEEPTAEEPTAEEPTVEEAIAGEPTAEEPIAEEPIAEEPIAEEPIAEEPIAEAPIQSVSQEEGAVNNNITPEHDAIGELEKPHTQTNSAISEEQFETASVPERMGDEPVNTQTAFDTDNKNKEEPLPEEEKKEVETKSNPFARVVAWFSRTPDNVVSIEANDTEPTLDNKNPENSDFERKRFF